MSQCLTWLTQTHELLNNRPAWLSFEQIAVDTGLTVAWLKSFSTKSTSNPGVNSVEILHKYLSNIKNS